MLIRRALLATALILPLAACDTGDTTDETVTAERFAGEMGCDTTDNAFRVVLNSDTDALIVGQNDLTFRLGMHDPTDAEAPGFGIPNARIDLDVWQPNGDGTMSVEPDIFYIGEGEYRIENVVVPESGVWQFDFTVEVGETMMDSVELAFEIL